MSNPKKTPAQSIAGSSPLASSTPSADIRSFRATKLPQTDVEMACVVAYYLESLAPPDERKQSIGKADLENTSSKPATSCRSAAINSWSTQRRRAISTPQTAVSTS